MKKILLSPWLALVTVVVLLSIRVYDPSFVESVRLRYFDQLITSSQLVTAPVHTINIDEAALEKYGQFPFSRDVYARIIEDLYSRNAGLVVFNVIMPEADRLTQDTRLSQTLEKYQVILPALGSTMNKNTDYGSPASIIGVDPKGLVVEFPGMINNIDLLGQRAAGVGIVNTFSEIDGVVRRTPLVIYSNQHLHPSLALETLRVAAGDPSFQIKIAADGVEALRVPKFGKITTDNLSRIWIDWSVQSQEHSLVDLPKSFNGEIVVVGVSAAGLANPIATSRGEVWPQTLQATVIGTMLNKTTIQRPSWADQYEILVILFAGILVIFLSRFTYAFIPVIVVIGASHFAVSYLYDTSRILLDITWFIVATTLVYVHAYSVKFLSEYLQKQQIKQQFGSYVNPIIVERLQKNPEFIKLGGEKKELSVVMSDMRNFTGLGEVYGEDVEGFTTIMNRYMTAIAEPILRNNGCLIKFIGDASLHVHGAPIQEKQDPDHVVAAVRTAIEMIEAVEKFNCEIEAEGKPRIGMGAGIYTGPTLVGNIGAKTRFAYDVLGDTVSMAARLEGQTKGYGVLLVIGELTAKRTGDDYFTIELDKIAVKGKTEGVNIYTVFRNPDAGACAEWLIAREHHDLMLEYYRQQQWDRAIELTNELIGEFDGNMDHYYELWLERIEYMRHSELPSDWSGTYVAKTK